MVEGNGKEIELKFLYYKYIALLSSDDKLMDQINETQKHVNNDTLHKLEQEVLMKKAENLKSEYTEENFVELIEESEKLLNYGFRYYDTQKLYKANTVIKINVAIFFMVYLFVL
mgnify:CR=1 FL=1